MDTSNLDPVDKSTNSYPVDHGKPGSLHTSDYYRHKNKRRGLNFRILGITILIIALCAVAAIGYLHFHDKSVKKGPQIVSTVPLTSKIGLTAATQQYNSTNLSLGFDYPQGWTVKDTAGTNILTVQSPTVELLTSANQLTKGIITLTIQNQSPVVAGFQSGNATAALESQLITYVNPTADQRASTYISFLHYASSTTPGSNIDAIYITGNAGYQLNQSIPQTAILAVSTVIGITFSRCTNTACTGSGVATSITYTAWDTTSFSEPLLTLLKSLSIS
jgi:hypothetical protein